MLKNEFVCMCARAHVCTFVKRISKGGYLTVGMSVFVLNRRIKKTSVKSL